jgi:hypothetical protein
VQLAGLEDGVHRRGDDGALRDFEPYDDRAADAAFGCVVVEHARVVDEPGQPSQLAMAYAAALPIDSVMSSAATASP